MHNGPLRVATWGASHLPCAVNTVTYLVDGFNLYHSLVDAQRACQGQTMKWLDLVSLCNRFLPLVGRLQGTNALLGDIYYFSAPPIHRSQAEQNRHTLYMECLTGTGVQLSLGQFKRKKEKETDVAIAAKLFEICHTGSAETVVLITRDTDLAPAVRVCQRLFPEMMFLFAFPYRRVNDELRQLAPGSFKIKSRTYLAHQFPDPLVLPDGTSIPKPSSW